MRSRKVVLRIGLLLAALLLSAFLIPRLTRPTTAENQPSTATVNAADTSFQRSEDGTLELTVQLGNRLQQVRRVDGAVRSFRVNDSLRYTPVAFFLRLGSELGLDNEDRMVPLPGSNASRAIGTCSSHRFQQYHRDVPVLEGFYTLIACDERVVAGLGLIVPGLEIDSAPQLTPSAALDSLRLALKREEPGVELKLSAPARLIVHAPLNGEGHTPRLVYRLLVASRPPFRNREILVDANSAALVRTRELARDLWTNIVMTGESQYDGMVEFFAQQEDTTGRIRLVSQNLIDIETKDAKLGSTLAASDHILLGTATNPADEEVEKAGLSAHWAAQGAIAYFVEKFGWLGADGASSKLRIFLRLQYPAGPGIDAFGENRAAWFGPDPFTDAQSPSPQQWQIIALNMGDGGVTHHPLVAPEVIGHELTHAIQYFQIGVLGGFSGSLEALALGESYGDIFGVLVESYVRQKSIDYVVGNDWALNWQRRMDDPSQSVPPQPAAYGDPLWNAPPPDATPHYWNGPHNRWFFLLAEGQPPLVTGIGTDKAEAIAFYAMTQLLFPDAGYADARVAEAFAAEFLFGPHTQSVASVLDAYAAINIGSGYVNSLVYLPAIDAKNIEPWPVDLAWEALGNETEWEIQLSADPHFVSDVSSRMATGAPSGNPPLVHLPVHQRPNLDGDTQYHWRVRGRSNGGAWQDWRLPVHFHTAEKPVEPLSPWSRELKEFHPWDLKFTWSSVQKAARYELQVAETPSSPIDWQKPLLAPEPVSETSMELDVRVDRDHAWRIRAHGPDGDFGPTHGIWTEVSFKTSLPRVKLLEPLDGAMRYPWPTDLRWEEVIGADHYLIDLTDCDGVFKSANPNSPLPCTKENPDLDYGPMKLGADTLNFALNVQPEWSHDHVLYWWQVRVIGPPPWFDEGGLPLENGQWTVYGDDTLPKKLDPPLMLANLPCRELGQAMEFKWEPVVNAVGYRLSLRELWAELGGQPQGTVGMERGAEIFAQSLPASDGASIVLPSLGAGPMSGPLHLGYWWHIEADGPDGYRGLADNFGSPYVIENDTPTPNMLDGHQFGLNDEVVLPWKSDHAIFGDYYVTVHLGNGCLDVNQVAKALIPGISPGKSTAVVDTVNMLEAEQHSWKVSNAYHLTSSQCYQGSMNSPCTTFISPGPVCGNGVVEGDETCDDGNLTLGDGCSPTCQAALACGQQHADAGGIELAYVDKEIALGGNKGTIWITTETYTIPDRLTFKHNGQIIAEVDCAGTEGAETTVIPINGGGSSIFVTVEPDCASVATTTKWVYAVSCVDDSVNLPPHDPEPSP